MTRGGWDLALTVFALWLAALLGILVMHYVNPGDPWVAMLARPSSLVFAPLIVAAIPLLAVKSDREAAEDYGDDDDSSNFERKPRWEKSGTLRKMALLWLLSLVVFGSPHFLGEARLDFILHNSLFLIVAPLLLACLPLFVRDPTLRRWGISCRPRAGLSSSFLWQGLISSIVMAPILVLCLIGVNSMKHAVGKISVNIAIGILLAGDLYVLQKAVKQLRNRRRLRDS
jgi:hypothetical protein